MAAALWYHCVDFSFVGVNCSVISHPLSGTNTSSFFLISGYSTFDFCHLNFYETKQIILFKFFPFSTKENVDCSHMLHCDSSPDPQVAFSVYLVFITLHKAIVYIHITSYSIAYLSGGVSFRWRRIEGNEDHSTASRSQVWFCS